VQKSALVCGISGQDGAYLSKLLLEQGYMVIGTSRDAQSAVFANLKALGLLDRVTLESMSLTDFRSVAQVILKYKPDEIYNLSGQSSVALSFQQPVETFESITIGTLNLLEAVRLFNPASKIYNASSGECFGETSKDGAVESDPFRPKTPYAVAKAAAFWEVVTYRESYNLFVCSGLLFNHESPLRIERFVTKKVVAAACRIAKGSKERLKVGDISIERDWGWAEDYVYAMYLMLQQPKADDFIIATGERNSLESFIKIAFEAVGLNWKEHVDADSKLLRPTDHRIGLGNPKKAEQILNWKPKHKMNDVVRKMIDHQLKETNK
jgi:GDPmannose 4,6-dehydratase